MQEGEKTSEGQMLRKGKNGLNFSHLWITVTLKKSTTFLKQSNNFKINNVLN